jgi:hypothetical protein
MPVYSHITHDNLVSDVGYLDWEDQLDWIVWISWIEMDQNMLECLLAQMEACMMARMEAKIDSS